MKKIYYFVFFIFLFSAIFGLREAVDEDFKGNSSKSVFIPPPEYIEYMSFGFNEVLADLLWVRWVQNIESCGKKLVDRSEIKTRFIASNETKKDTVYLENQRQKVCDQGWSFRMLNEVTDLSPKFRVPYTVGATSLSVLSEDHIGAKKIYEKAFKNFPTDWQILYRAAYHYLFELNDFFVGSQLLKRAADSGGPDWLYSYSARMAEKSGRADFGIRVLYEYLENIKSEEHRAEILARIETLKKMKE